MRKFARIISPMKSSMYFNFDSTYLRLPEKFYERIHFQGVSKPEWIVKNEELRKSLNIDGDFDETLLQILSGNQWNSTPFSQAYAGHQFGHFTMLGDGRATILGEHLDAKGNRWDIQIKGSGPTPYSRRGDGRATLRSMLKEYLFSEVLHDLGIPSSRSLAVVKTGERVYREEIHEGAILTRVMKSHIRIGTFEYARYFGTQDDVETLLNYSVNRLYPELKNSSNLALAFLEKVMKIQIDLIVNWMRVGFIHGVMNTDNISISGETFDFGPCAFMGVYDPSTVYSSIDQNARYSFENQPKILKWNLARLAETLLSLIHPEEKVAIELAIQKINEFDSLYMESWYKMMFSKLGITEEKEGDSHLVDEFLEYLYQLKLDYTNSFAQLTYPELFDEKENDFPKEMNSWIEKWKIRIENELNSNEIMRRNNPIMILRNQSLEEILKNAEEGNFSQFHNLLNQLESKKRISSIDNSFLRANPEFDSQYKTFCGT